MLVSTDAGVRDRNGAGFGKGDGVIEAEDVED